MQDGTRNNQDLVDLWNNSTELQRWVIFLLCWLEMQKKTKMFWVVFISIVGGCLLFAVSRDPITAAVAFVIGLGVGSLFILR